MSNACGLLDVMGVVRVGISRNIDLLNISFFFQDCCDQFRSFQAIVNGEIQVERLI